MLKLFYEAPEDGAGVPGAEQAGAGADGGTEQAGEADGGQQPETQTIDTEQAERIAQERAERATRSALTDYYKQQGLTPDEARQAFEAYKSQRDAQRQAQMNDLTALQQANMQLTQQVQQAHEDMQKVIIRARAESIAHSMGIKPERVPHALRLAALQSVTMDEEGQPDEAAIRTALDEVLAEIPELKVVAEENVTGFKVGAKGQDKGTSQVSQIAKIFGNE